MLKKVVLTLAFSLVPALAMAQHHQHAAPKHHDPAKLAEHKDFAQQLIALGAELKLTDAQITKLRALSVKMTEHHKTMGKDLEKDIEAEEKLHGELLTLFTAEQKKKVHTLLLKHVSEICGGTGKDQHCKVDKAGLGKE